MNQLEVLVKWRNIVNSACRGSVSLLCRDLEELELVEDAVQRNVDKNGGWMVANPNIPYHNFMFKGCYFVWYGE